MTVRHTIALVIAAVATPVAHAEIVHQSGLDWRWPSGFQTVGNTRTIAGQTFQQDGYVRFGRFSMTFSTSLSSDGTVQFGPFGFDAGFTVTSDGDWSGAASVLQGTSSQEGNLIWGMFLEPDGDSSEWPLYSVGYLGIRIADENSPGSWRYGWMRIESPGGPALYGYVITDYAYETTPNTPIMAGAVPAPGAAAVLALGGLVAARRRR